MLLPMNVLASAVGKRYQLGISLYVLPVSQLSDAMAKEEIPTI